MLAKERIFVVKEVIESWYLAGISEEQKEKFKIENFTDTQCLNKHYFDALSNAPDFRIEILKGYSLEKAVFCNASLCYFNDKFLKKYAIINNT
ncbi:MAG: hypothetical protein IPL35_04270 [Sphingobacteriales bacterium]|nr:hypothetical protein [Sphingobacteriales bacterium]